MQNIRLTGMNNYIFFVSYPSLLSATSAPGVTTPENTMHTPVPVLPLNMVAFLGLDLSPHDAGVALYVIFAFLIVGILGISFVAYGLLKTRKKSATVDIVKIARM